MASDNQNPCDNAGTESMVLSLAVAKVLSNNRTIPELSVLASFFSSLSANLSVIIQNRNFCSIMNQSGTSTSETAAEDEEDALPLPPP